MALTHYIEADATVAQNGERVVCIVVDTDAPPYLTPAEWTEAEALGRSLLTDAERQFFESLDGSGPPLAEGDTAGPDYWHRFDPEHPRPGWLRIVLSPAAIAKRKATRDAKRAARHARRLAKDARIAAKREANARRIRARIRARLAKEEAARQRAARADKNPET